jgi:hypothetical protein
MSTIRGEVDMTVTEERQAAELAPESLCIACESGTHEDRTAVASGQRCDCPCHRHQTRSKA